MDWKNNNWKCDKCGKVLPSGIVGISDHWAGCEGKEYMEELMEQKNYGTLSYDSIVALNIKYFDKN